MNKILNLYNNILDEFKSNNFGETHGIQILHKGVNIDSNSILFIGRENRGHGNKINNFSNPINNFIITNFDWLDDSYKYTKSPFWRVVGKSMSHISKKAYNIEIFKYIYWSNLYKASPYLRKPNTVKARKKQFQICQNLLSEEIKYLKPKGVVFLTDSWINLFLKEWDENEIIIDIQTNEALNYFNKSFNFLFDNTKIPCIVLPHPQNNKSGASENDLINHISNTLK